MNVNNRSSNIVGREAGHKKQDFTIHLLSLGALLVFCLGVLGLPFQRVEGAGPKPDYLGALDRASESGADLLRPGRSGQGALSSGTGASQTGATARSGQRGYSGIFGRIGQLHGIMDAARREPVRPVSVPPKPESKPIAKSVTVSTGEHNGHGDTGSTGVDVPNGLLKDPLPLPTGEVCERKPTYKNGKIIDQWKVDISRRFWEHITTLGWNYADKVRAMMTIINEGDFDPGARGDADNGGSGAICGLHFYWQRFYLRDNGAMDANFHLTPKFSDITWQIKACAEKYAEGAKMYGYRDAIHMDGKTGKRAKAQKALNVLTCK